MEGKIDGRWIDGRMDDRWMEEQMIQGGIGGRIDYKCVMDELMEGRMDG